MITVYDFLKASNYGAAVAQPGPSGIRNLRFDRSWTQHSFTS